MAWLLPKEHVGMIGVVASWLPFVQLLSLPGLDSASYHYVAKGEFWAYAANLRHRLAWSLVSTGVFLLGAAYWQWQGNPSLCWLFVIAGLTFPITAGLSACSGTLGAIENFTGLFWYRIGSSLARFAGFIPIAFASWWFSQAVTFYTVNQFTTAIVQVGVSLWLFQLMQRLSTAPRDVSQTQEMVRYGRHLTGIASLGTVQTRSDALIVGMFLPLTVMADYSIAILVHTQLKQLWNIYLLVRYPPFVRLSIERRIRRMALEGLLVWGGFVIVGVALIGLAYWFIPILLPPEYRNSVGYIAWLVSSFVLLIPGAFAEVFFRSEQDEKRQYILRSISALAGVIIPVSLVAILGIDGVLIGRVVTSIIFSIAGILLVLYVIRKKAVLPLQNE